jgi:glycosyltransferase involved in cell wall biosynthesis
MVVRNGIPTAAVDRSVGAELRATLGIPQDAFVVGTIARLAAVKRQDLMLRAFATLSDGVPAARLLLVGDGPERSNLAALANELRVADRVVFAGYQSAPERFLAVFDAFALSSDSEGLPLSLLEGWSAGLPVVVSAVGGLAVTVAHERDGLLFSKGDAGAMATALRRLAVDPSLCLRLGENGRAKVRAEYSLERMASEYDGIYRSVIEGRG